MIHQYKLNGYNIVLDVYSGSVHAVDDVAYDAIALLDAGKKVAVASGSYRFIVDRCLEAAGLSDIPIKVTASEVKKCKPDPEGYLRAAELLGADPKDCLVFEDTPVGVKAAQAAGMRVFRFYDTLRDGPNV